MTTLREHLEAIRNLSPKRGAHCVCPACQINEHTRDALAILNLAGETSDGYLLIADPYTPQPDNA